MGDLDKLVRKIIEKKKINMSCGEAWMIFHAWREDSELGYEILESSASCPSFQMMSKEEFEKGRNSQTLSEYYCDIWQEGYTKEEIVSDLVKELEIKEGEDRYFEWICDYSVGESTQDYWGEWDAPEEFIENERWQEVSKEEYDRIYN